MNTQLKKKIINQSICTVASIVQKGRLQTFENKKNKNQLMSDLS